MRTLTLFVLLLASAANAADFDTKDKVYNYFSVIIPYQAEAVWAVLRDFPHMPKWNHQFEDLQLFVVGKDTLAREMRGKDPVNGAPRSVFEKLNVLDDEKYHFSYSVIPYTEQNMHLSPFPANVLGHRADARAHPITEGEFAGQTYLEWRIQKDGPLEEELLTQNGKSNQYIFSSLFKFMTTYLDEQKTVKTDNYDLWSRSTSDAQIHRIRNFQGSIVEAPQANVLTLAKDVYPTLGENQVLPRSEGLPWPRLGALSGSSADYNGEVVIAPVIFAENRKLTFVGKREIYSTGVDIDKMAAESRSSFVAEIQALAQAGKDEL